MSTESAAPCFTSLPLSWCDHLIAILVNQGSDPTVPYQALVIRESAKLFLGRRRQEDYSRLACLLKPKPRPTTEARPIPLAQPVDD